MLSPQQQESYDKTGEISLPDQQKKSWTDAIDPDVSVTWGVFDSSFKPQPRAVGIWGSYPAQYMKKEIFKRFAIYYLSAFMLLTFSSCDEDTFVTTWFRCEINGERFKSYHSGLPFGSNSPYTTYYQAEEYSFFSFYTSFSPENELIELPQYFINYHIYLNEPLAMGERYYFSTLPGMEHSVIRKDRQPLLSDRISHVYLHLDGDWDNLSFGSGYVQFTGREEDGYYIKGIVELEFTSPIEKDGVREQLKLKGEFRSVFRTE